MVRHALLLLERPISDSRELPNEVNGAVETVLSLSSPRQELPLAEHDMQHTLQVPDTAVHNLTAQVVRVLLGGLAELRRHIEHLVVKVLAGTAIDSSRADKDHCGRALPLKKIGAQVPAEAHGAEGLEGVTVEMDLASLEVADSVLVFIRQCAGRFLFQLHDRRNEV